MMTKKDFAAIAQALNDSVHNDLAGLPASYRRDTRDIIARNLADYFETRNPSFNRIAFLRECGTLYSA